MTVSVAGGDVCSEFVLITTHLYWPLKEELVAVTVRVLLVAVERLTPGAVVVQLYDRFSPVALQKNMACPPASTACCSGEMVGMPTAGGQKALTVTHLTELLTTILHSHVRRYRRTVTHPENG